MSKYLLSILLVLYAPFVFSQDVINFDDYFIDKTMRIDFFLTGAADEEIVTVDQIYQQGIWAGNPLNLLDNFNNGSFYIKIIDLASNKLIYSRGFNCYFEEYQTTTPAINGIKRTYHNSALIPFPRQPIFFVLEKRDKNNILHSIFTKKIEPGDFHIIKENVNNNDRVYIALKNGDPYNKVDLAWLAEGYTIDEWEKFKSDVDRYLDIFLGVEPYKSNKQKFNIYGVFRASSEGGVDEPRKGIFKNTPMNYSFNALDVERYLLTEDNKTMRDIASHVPYDAVIVMVNSERYGGGGIYNSYAVSTVDNKLSPNVFLHEFGHSFAGLADEYYSSDVAYNDFYPKGVEPTEPNITALLDPLNVKWKNLLAPGIKVPTDWGKAEYDALEKEKGNIRKEKAEKIAKLKKEGASEKELNKVEQEYEQKNEAIKKKYDMFHEKYKHLANKVGVFEGAGYSSTGLYRPELNCMMFANVELRFCRVCQQAIQRMIDFYGE